MLGRRRPPEAVEYQSPQMGFDDYELRLGDIMRGERATMGKSLLDVQRDLKIKASHIAAIENADLSAFATPGFAAGYVRSYARYLGLDPDWAFRAFCREADFVPPSAAGNLAGKPAAKTSDHADAPVLPREGGDPFAAPRVAFLPKSQGAFTGLEPRAIGSILVLVSLISAVGYGGWAVLQEVQRVDVTPVDRAPAAVTVLDPIDGVMRPEGEESPEVAAANPAENNPLGRIYLPQPLDVPVMVPRDGPIAVIDPRTVGSLAGRSPDGPGDAWSVPEKYTQAAEAYGAGAGSPGQLSDPDAEAIGAAVSEALQAGYDAPIVTADQPDVVVLAVRPAWVRVRAGDGSVLLEKILNPGDSYVVPKTEEPPTLRTGAAGAIYFAVNGKTYGPAGGNGQVVDKIALGADDLAGKFALADPAADADAQKAVAVAEAALAPSPAASGDTPAEN